MNIKVNLKSSIASSILMSILGLLLIFKSEQTIVSFSYIIGGILVALGFVSLFRFARNANNNTSFGSELDIVYGVVTVILGILTILNPKFLGSIIPFIIGGAIVISSASKMQYSFELRKNGNTSWITSFVISALSTIAGIVLIFNPFKGAAMLLQIVGIFILIYAVLDIVTSIIINKNKPIQKKKKIDFQEANIIEEETESVKE